MPCFLFDDACDGRDGEFRGRGLRTYCEPTTNRRQKYVRERWGLCQSPLPASSASYRFPHTSTPGSFGASCLCGAPSVPLSCSYPYFLSVSLTQLVCPDTRRPCCRCRTCGKRLYELFSLASHSHVQARWVRIVWTARRQESVSTLAVSSLRPPADARTRERRQKSRKEKKISKIRTDLMKGSRIRVGDKRLSC